MPVQLLSLTHTAQLLYCRFLVLKPVFLLIEHRVFFISILYEEWVLFLLREGENIMSTMPCANANKLFMFWVALKNICPITWARYSILFLKWPILSWQKSLVGAPRDILLQANIHWSILCREAAVLGAHGVRRPAFCTSVLFYIWYGTTGQVLWFSVFCFPRPEMEKTSAHPLL